MVTINFVKIVTIAFITRRINEKDDNKGLKLTWQQEIYRCSDPTRQKVWTWLQDGAPLFK